MNIDNNNTERPIHKNNILKELLSSSWSRYLITILGLIGIGLLIEIIYLIKFEHGFVLKNVLEMEKKVFRIFGDDINQVERIEFKRKTVMITHEDINMKSEVLSMRRSANTDQLFIVKLVDKMSRKSPLTSNGIFEKTYLLQSGNIYLIRADQNMIKDVENEILWIKPFENELKTNIDMFYIHEAHKNSSRERQLSLELLLIPSLGDLNSMRKVTERFQTNFIAFMNYISNDYKIEIPGDGMIDIQVPIKLLDKIATFLIEDPNVKWIQRREPMKTSNKVATKHAQGLRSDSELKSNSNPIWERNITGEGEIVTIADTGLDYDNCYFSDPNSTVTTGEVNKDHRKVLAYINMSNSGKTADGKDTLDGHGTHVCGSVAGYIQSNDTMSDYNGIAFKSKIIMLDIENEYNSELLIPSDIRTMFLQGYNLNSRIFSNSYTCSYASLFSCTYDCKCYLLQDEDSLGVKFALVDNVKCQSAFGLDCCRMCNNYGKRDMQIDDFLYENQDAVVVFAAGNEGSQAVDGTIASTSKNAIIVGASMSSNQGFVDSIQYVNLDEEAETCGVTTDTCCSDYSCSFTCCPERMETQLKVLKTSFNQNNIAYFSARGPATGNRLKPDCVAVGDRVASARSDGSLTTNQCGNLYPNATNDAALKVSSGTSMSTPIVSGSLALIREYFRKYKGISNPSGPLLKATLINSCTSLKGAVSLDGSDSTIVTLADKSPPNKYEGFGAIGLSNILEFDDSAFKLEFLDRQEISAGGGSSVQCFTTTSKDPNSFLKATLAWYDAPNQANSIPRLYADLDLTILVYENGRITQTLFGNGMTEKDSLNNVEKVTISDIDIDSTIMVKVSAAATAQSQKFTLVLTRSKNMKLEESSKCQLLDKVNTISIITVGVLISISFVAFCILSIICLGACVCCCVLRKSATTHIQVKPAV